MDEYHPCLPPQINLEMYPYMASNNVYIRTYVCAVMKMTNLYKVVFKVVQ